MSFLKQFIFVFLRKFRKFRKVFFIFVLSLSIAVSPSVILAQTTPQDLVQEGRSYYEAGDLQEAIASLEEAVDLFR